MRVGKADARRGRACVDKQTFSALAASHLEHDFVFFGLKDLFHASVEGKGRNFMDTAGKHSCVKSHFGYHLSGFAENIIAYCCNFGKRVL